MYDLNILESVFLSAYRCNLNYVGVRVRIEGENPADEFIINPRANILSKLEYYKSAYNEDLTLKSNPNVKIVGLAYGNNFDEIQRLI